MTPEVDNYKYPQGDAFTLAPAEQNQIETLLDRNFPREITNRFPGIFFILDEQRHVIRCNHNLTQILGYSGEELSGMDVLFVVSEENRSFINSQINAGFTQGNVSAEVDILTRQGQKIPFYLTWNYILMGGKKFLIGTGLEIGELKRAEDEIRRRNKELEAIVSVSKAMRITNNLSEFYQVILEQVSDLFGVGGVALALNDPIKNDSVIQLGLHAWSDWTGQHIPLTPEEGTRTVRITPEDIHSRQPGIALNLLNEQSFILDIPLTVNQERLGTLWVGHTSSISPSDQRLLTAIGDMAANAIHRQKLLENLQVQLTTLNKTRVQLVQSEKLAAIGELVAGVAHELNNPLTSVILYSRLVQEHCQDREINQDMEIIVQESQRAARIVHGLLDFSRQLPVEKRPIQINDILKSSLGILTFELNTHHISKKIILSPNLPMVMADPMQLQQVFINLLNNAWQAISAEKKSGHITITVEAGLSQFDDGHVPHALVIHILIRDDGPGIPADKLTRIFDPFFTTKPEGQGTGLGLSICHGIISEHSGHIWAENNPDQGATFHIELPGTIGNENEITPAKKAQLPAELTIKNASILVVDDEPGILHIISRLLKRNGYKVDTANDGNLALGLLNEQHFDLIICDIRMPGTNGPEFYALIQKEHPELTYRIIFTTGDLISPNIRQFLDNSGTPFLAKPFEFEQLINSVENALRLNPE